MAATLVRENRPGAHQAASASSTADRVLRAVGERSPWSFADDGDSLAGVTAPIICGVDGSGPSLAAARLARNLGQGSGRPVQYVYVARTARQSYAVSHVRAVHERLAEAVGRDAALGVLTGMPSTRLAQSTRHASMLVLGTHGRCALRHAIGASMSTTVTCGAAAPVVVVPPHAGDVPRTPLSDRGLVCGVRDERDLPCVATSVWLARELDLRLTLAHVVPPRRLPVAPAGGAPPPGLVRSADEEATTAFRMLDDIACAIAPSAPTVCRTRVAHGRVAQELNRIAASEDAVLVALGSSRSRTFGDAFARSGARHLMRRGQRAVMMCPALEGVFARPEHWRSGGGASVDMARSRRLSL
jgi:nucleotide-binding universal stress UspA family protein